MSVFRLCDTYSLNKIIDHLNHNDIKFVRSSANVGFSMTHHGCRIQLGEDIELSIQTHPDIAMNSFAETALIYKKKYINNININNEDTILSEGVVRHKTPDALFEYIINLKNKINNDSFKLSDMCITSSSARNNIPVFDRCITDDNDDSNDSDRSDKQ